MDTIFTRSRLDGVEGQKYTSGLLYRVSLQSGKDTLYCTILRYHDPLMERQYCPRQIWRVAGLVQGAIRDEIWNDVVHIHRCDWCLAVLSQSFFIALPH